MKSLLKVNEQIVRHSGASIFMYYTALAKEHGAVNFGQGFPNWHIPSILEENLSKVVTNPIQDNFDFTFGTKKLLQALEKDYSPLLKRDLDWKTNIQVTAGATASLVYLAESLTGTDELIVVEPYFPWHRVPAEIFTKNIHYTRLSLQDNGEFGLDYDHIDQLCNENTKYLIVNSPHNPMGKLFNQKDFEILTALVNKYKNLNIISDEVYERVAYDGKEFPRLAANKDLFDRSISVYSGGKTFSCTGWRLGWSIGPENLITPLKEIQRKTNDQTSSVLQDACALAIEDAYKPYHGYTNYYEFLTHRFQVNKDKLYNGLKNSPLGFKVFNPEGGHFVTAEIRDVIKHMPIKYFYKLGKSDRMDKLARFEDWKLLEDIDYFPDEALCTYLTIEYKVSPIGCSNFYFKSSKHADNDHEICSYLRFAVCKKEEDIDQLAVNLSKLK